MLQATALTAAAPSRWHRQAALVSAGLLATVAACVLPIGAMPLAPNPGFMPAFGAMTFLGSLVTAALLFSQARAAQDRAAADLGAAYLFSSMVVIPHLLAFPGVFAVQSLIGGSASAVWLWVAWHAGFALFVARYAWRRGSNGAGTVRLTPRIAIVAAIVLALTLAATWGLAFLPLILVGSGFARLNTLGVGPAVLLCNVAALLLVTLRLRGRTVIDLWLAVAMLAATLDVVLTLCGAGRYTLGWYVARLLSLGTDVTILVALLSELGLIFATMTAVNKHLEALSLTDSLTQIANRRGLDEALARAWSNAQRDETPVSLLMIDADHFKGFNDAYGHPAGDDCLRRIAALIGSHARRPYDVAARIGGEEFALLMPATDEAGAAMIAGRVRHGIENLLIPHAASRFGHVTISAGVATARPYVPGEGPASLIEAADRALYTAKNGGRNRVEIAHGAADQPEKDAHATPWQEAVLPAQA